MPGAERNSPRRRHQHRLHGAFVRPGDPRRHDTTEQFEFSAGPKLGTECIDGCVNNTLTLLGLLSREPSYGYDLKHSYDRYFGAQKPLAFGQVYSTLSRMFRDELIRALGEETGGGPDRKKYEITPAGKDRVRQWLFTPDVPSETLQSELFAKTVVAVLLGDDADRLLDVQRAEHMARMRELTRIKRDADLLQVLMCDHGLFHIEADLRWIDLTSARLAQLKKELQSA
jgi:DNA-binding PadR family transcriptional regulator